MTTFIVPHTTAPQSAKEFLRQKEGISLNLWRKIKQNDEFYINHKKENPGLATVSPGDEISYTLAQHSTIEPIQLPLEICYEDDYLLIVNKPAGQLVHPTTKERQTTLANAILYYYKQNNLQLMYHPVHRLDKNTSGLVLIAKMPQIQHLLSTGSTKLFKRTYKTIVTGKPADSGLINAPIGRKPTSIIERMVTASGQIARTHYKLLQTNGTYSLLEVELETGRTHQIRVHLAYIGHSILGDDLYGGSLDLIDHQALHASKLVFIHPVTHKNITIICDLPIDMQRIISTL